MARRGWLLLAPWWRGPLLLARRPGVAVALGVAAVVVALPAASSSLFLSSAGSATLRARTASVCPATIGSQVIAPEQPIDASSVPALDAALAEEATAAAKVPGLGAPTVTLVSSEATVATAAGRTQVNIAGRDDLAGHVQLVAGGPGPGLWLPDRFTTASGLRPGDTLMIFPSAGIWVPDPTGQSPNGLREVAEPTAVPVVAIYRDLRDRSDDAFWCSLSRLYRGDPAQQSGSPGQDKPILDLVLADRATMLSVASRAHILTARASSGHRPEPI